ncbi:MAG: hypothetical protein A3E01_19020 [Gammaproteobacteria bacterium RIFCSPHIGHO2_12_FULL_63_22]|nr:MAG: hypothetical protein A3E01_19020 [Gammaproteobacteria bacterium RIFCSPHIGHO2_12_FULL_63_22]
MNQTTDDLADIGPDPDWRPKSLRTPAPPWLPRPVRASILAAVLVVHGLVLAWWLPRLATPRHPIEDQTAIRVEFIRDPPPVVIPVEAEVRTTEKVELPKSARPVRKRPRIQSDMPLQALPSPPTEDSKLELYGADGRLKVPDDMLEQIDRKYGDKRVFSYQVPRLDDAKKAFYRNPAITYEKTRFDEYWKPDQDLLTGLLSEMVEKTTKQIKIPVPGRPDSKMVCTISLLALGGGCGVLTNGSDYVGPLDDPDTLSPEEDRQCKAWWDQIVGARTQDAWRKTRKLYEELCRKPLERVPAG